MANEKDLLKQFEDSMKNMQNQMQSTYQVLEKMHIKGESGGVTITLTCTYKFVDIDIQPKAMQGGLKDFVYHLRQAWTLACDNIQKTTQGKTLELLETVDIPESIRKMGEKEGENEDDSNDKKEDSNDGGTGTAT